MFYPYKKIAFLLLLVYTGSFGQKNKNDSLSKLLQTLKVDSLLAKVKIDLGYSLIRNYPDSTLKLYEEAVVLAGKSNNQLILAKAYIYTARFYHNAKANYSMALDNFIKALKIYENLGLVSNQAKTLRFIGAVYYRSANYFKSKEFLSRALDLAVKTKDKEIEAGVHYSLGMTHTELFEYEASLAHTKKALLYFSAVSDSIRVQDCYCNIGSVLLRQEKFDTALICFTNAKTILKLKTGKYGNGRIHFNISYCYLKLNKEKEGLKYALEGFELAKNSNDIVVREESYYNLYKAYDANKDKGKALAFYERYVALRDSLSGIDVSMKMGGLENNYIAQKEALQRELMEKAERAKAEYEKKQHQLVIIIISIALVIFIILSALIFNRFRLTRKQKVTIEQQKKLVDEKQKEIVDSINYAQRIQNSLITSEKYIHKALERLQKKD